ncbi:MAG: thioredoxin family protein [Pseudomonadota bacterium]
MTIRCLQCGIEQEGKSRCGSCGFAFESRKDPVVSLVRKGFRAGLAVILVLMLAAGSLVWYQTRSKPDAGHDEKGKVPWIMDHDQGLALSRESGRPAMLFFTAAWCGYCRKMIREVFSEDAVVRATSRVVSVFIDVDQHADLMDRYAIRGVPAVYFLAPGGKILHKLIGARDAKAILTMIDQVAPPP